MASEQTPGDVVTGIGLALHLETAPDPTLSRGNEHNSGEQLVLAHARSAVIFGEEADSRTLQVRYLASMKPSTALLYSSGACNMAKWLAFGRMISLAPGMTEAM